MPNLRLWGNKKSSNVLKVLWALEELGLPFELVNAGAEYGRVKEADYLALNPNGLVPTLEDGPVALWESNAIVRYLYARYGTHPGYPDDPTLRGRADGFHDWYSSTLWPPIRTVLVQLVRTPEAQRDAKLIEQSRTAALRALAILDRELTKKPFVAGDHFTYGDIPVAIALHRWYIAPTEHPSLPAVDAYHARIKQRPGFKQYVDPPKG